MNEKRKRALCGNAERSFYMLVYNILMSTRLCRELVINSFVLKLCFGCQLHLQTFELLDIYGREHLFKENDVVEAKITDGGVSFLIDNCWTFNYRIADICENFEII